MVVTDLSVSSQRAFSGDSRSRASEMQASVAPPMPEIPTILQPPPPHPLLLSPAAPAVVIEGVNGAWDAPLIVQKAYQVGVIILLSIGLFYCIKTLFTLQRHFHRLSPVIKYHTVVIIQDISMCLNFITRDVYHLYNDLPLQTGDWCTWSAYVAMISVTSTYLSAAWVAYATYSMTDRRPVSWSKITMYYTLSLAVSCTMASLISGRSLGPYKGLYCAMELSEHFVSTTVPFIVVYTASLGFMGFWYLKALEIFRLAPPGTDATQAFITRASSMLLSEGVTLMLVSQMTWAFLLFNGIITAMGFKVHYLVDIAAAWVAKLQPSVDSIVLMHMMTNGATLVKHAEDHRLTQRDDEGGSSSTTTTLLLPGAGGDSSQPGLDLKDMEKNFIEERSKAIMNSAVVRRVLASLAHMPPVAGEKAKMTMGSKQQVGPSPGAAVLPPPDLTGMLSSKLVDGKSKGGLVEDTIRSFKRVGNRVPRGQMLTGY